MAPSFGWPMQLPEASGTRTSRSWALDRASMGRARSRTSCTVTTAARLSLHAAGDDAARSSWKCSAIDAADLVGRRSHVRAHRARAREPTSNAWRRVRGGVQ